MKQAWLKCSRIWKLSANCTLIQCIKIVSRFFGPRFIGDDFFLGSSDSADRGHSIIRVNFLLNIKRTSDITETRNPCVIKVILFACFTYIDIFKFYWISSDILTRKKISAWKLTRIILIHCSVIDVVSFLMSKQLSPVIWNRHGHECLRIGKLSANFTLIQCIKIVSRFFGLFYLYWYFQILLNLFWHTDKKKNFCVEVNSNNTVSSISTIARP
jgi:hypothetical protein